MCDNDYWSGDSDDSTDGGGETMERYLVSGWLVCTLWFAAAGCQGVFPQDHSGVIEHNQVWSGVHRIVDDLVVDAAQVRIQCGTHVEVAPGATVEIAGGGQIISSGRPECPVVWTSAAARPRPGDWNGIGVGAGSQFLATDTSIEYAGRHRAALHVAHRARAELERVRIYRSNYDGIRVERNGRLPLAENLRFSRVAETPLHVPAAALGVIENPVFHRSDSRLLVDGGVVTDRTMWDFPDLTVVLRDDVRVRAPIEISADTTLRFQTGARAIVEHGGIIRAKGRRELAYDSPHRFVRLDFQIGSGLEFRGSAGKGSLFRWTVFEGPASLDAVPLYIGESVEVDIEHSFRQGKTCDPTEESKPEPCT